MPTVCVVGLGKIGLPLAVQYARQGMTVIGADISPTVVDLINEGVAPFPGETNLDSYLSAVHAAGSLTATTSTSEAVARSDVVVVVVPLVVDGAGNPDFRALDAATKAIADGLRRHTLVVYETTLPVGTTRTRFLPALEAGSGLPRSDFEVAFSPERVYSGRIFADLRRYPKLVGGIDDFSGQRAVDFYELALEFDERADLARPNGVWNLGSVEAAELAKLAETTYRDINIAFANELAIFAEGSGIDVFEVIEASNSQPFSHIHLPGVAVGGHCIPVYPRLFLANAPDARVPAAARATNDAMPRQVVERLGRELGGLAGRRVVILGAAYRGGVKETAFSGVFPLMRVLSDQGATVTVHDPLYTDTELLELGLPPHHLGSPVDAAIVQADHEMYGAIRPADLPEIEVLLDGRRCTDPMTWIEAGVIHLQVGQAVPNSRSRV